MTHVLVTGGAGYIGSHTVKELLAKGYRTVVMDNLSQGHRAAVLGGELIVGNIHDKAALDELFTSHKIEAVLHFAGKISVGESVENPQLYYHENLVGGLFLLKAMVEHGVRRIVFSSSAAVYGEPQEKIISETHPIHPLTPYGYGKAAFERILNDFDVAYDIKSISLRYFNAAGADPGGEIGEAHSPETHLIPRVLQALLDKEGRGTVVNIYGTDYPTHDGTCIRDYIHVSDLASAHVLALERLLAGAPSASFNLGNGIGYSVRDVINAAERTTGLNVAIAETERRPGDPAILVASSENIRRELGWDPKTPELDKIISTAWKWHRNKRY